MKRFLAVVAGFVTTSAIFATGAGVSLFMVMNKPVSEFDPGEQVAALWSAEAHAGEARFVSADSDARGSMLLYETKLAELEAHQPTPAEAKTDPVQVASLDPNIGMEATQPKETGTRQALPEKHISWCNAKYRSYRMKTNSYTPYSGGQKPCVSPYYDGGMQVAENTAASNGLPASHVRDCMERYRSYRISDNTFQPYGGGPRKQCR